MDRSTANALAYVEQVLVPSLKPGDIVIVDNFGSHKGKKSGVPFAPPAPSCFSRPPYNPDLNPIEQVFAKLKTLVREAAERSVEATWRRIGALTCFTPQECANYPANAGYASTSCDRTLVSASHIPLLGAPYW